jgi:alkanesulfonate monooxygenase SsuD/methylene tetrahydromethanopterin reductase-like flavin-dependent oxidoreductase (luciferase family)
MTARAQRFLTVWIACDGIDWTIMQRSKRWVRTAEGGWVTGRQVGLVLGSSVGPERLQGMARDADAMGFDELWLSEDFFFTGGVSSASIALAATERINVGLGVVSALVRHPALLAMELATMARAFPGRLQPGIGLGVPGWLRQMGLEPNSPLGAMRECVTAVRSLLAGERVTVEGRRFHFDQVVLTYPTTLPPQIRMGVIGPKMLELSGEIADGSIFSVAAGLDYVRWAREHIDAGRRKAGRSDPHGITVFALYSVDEDGDRARRALRPALAFYKAAGGANALTEVAGISEQVVDMKARGGADVIAREMPDSWVRDLTIGGTPDECAAQLRAFFDAGVDSVALFPVPADEADRIARLTAEEVLPQVR